VDTNDLGNPINPNDLINFDTQSVSSEKYKLSAQNFLYKKEISKRRYWTIRRGDTLGKIAMRTGVPISKLCSLNGIRKNSILRIGRKLRYT
jgi:LysM repeat protein